MSPLPTHMPAPPRQQRGAIAIMLAVMILVMLGFIGLAIDLSRLYNRKVELQTVADTAALAAARRLTGGIDGIDAAVAAASEIAGEARFNYGKGKIPWSPAALSFGVSASGKDWLDATAAKAVAGTISFVRVDTRELDDKVGTIETFFIRFVSPGQTSASTSAAAVAGRSSLNVTPIAICAMSPIPAAPRAGTGELLEFGFRRGVGYELNSDNGGKSPENFVINPIDTNGASASAGNSMADIVGPFVCAGTIPMGSIVGVELRVSRPFPLAALYQHLNSRFDQYDGGYCNYRSAPPDFNIKPYVFDKVRWMATDPERQTAAPAEAKFHPLRTIADLDTEPQDAAPAYGALWTFAKPVPFSAYDPTKPEPNEGYAAYPSTDWADLYAAGKPAPKPSYPETTPYGASGGANFTGPENTHGDGIAQRRVLNVPLLLCPVSNGAGAKATVLAIGKFFMTVPATATSISGEFAGIASGEAMSGSVELYQ